jgi:alpha-mannosidase
MPSLPRRCLGVALAAFAIVNHGGAGMGAQVPKRIYIANDDHTDYMWSADEAAYRQAFLDMLDFYVNQADRTAANPSQYQGRFSTDGSFWIWEYEHNQTATQFARLMERVKDGHITVPLNPLVLAPGGMPAEAVIRGMYYAGQLERRFHLRLPLAAAVESHTQPYGLTALWAGSGAKYSWKGVCGCDTRLPMTELANREHEIYWMTAPDGSRILMKWNSLLGANTSIGGYAEARSPSAIVEFVDSDPAFLGKYPYAVIGAFGKGWDDIKTLTDEFVSTARTKTTSARQVYVSNEIDFFRDFEATYGSALPSVSASFGNEWELYSASMSELSAGVKRALVTLRAAEAMASLVALKHPAFLDGRQPARDKAMINLGLYFEHDWHGNGPIPRDARRDWQRRIAAEITTYVNSLFADARTALGSQILRAGTGSRFFAFNPLGWKRTDVAQIPYSGTTPLHVVDLTTGLEVPSQVVTVAAQQHVQILAPEVPSVGYKVFEIRTGTGSTSWPDAATVSGGNVLENDFYRITLSNRGAVTSWQDKTRGNRELVLSRDGYYVNDLGPGTGSVRLETAGPVSVTIAATAALPLAHTTRLTVARGSRRVSLENEITQNFGTTESWRFSFNLPSPTIRHEEVGAIVLARLTSQGGQYETRNARYDWLTLNHFADVTGGDQVGVTLSNSDLYFMQLGNSSVRSLDSTTPLVKVLAGGQVDGPNLGIQNQGGDGRFLQRFALQTHGGFDAAAAMRFALEHQNPLVTGDVTGGTDYPEKSYSLLELSDAGTLLWALKPAEDGIESGLTVRMWNVNPSASTVTVRVPGGSIQTASRTSHIETVEEPVTLQSGSLVATLAANQLRTYLVKPVTGPSPPQNVRIVR